MALELNGSVGKGGTNNPDDVAAVKRRLVELSFEFFPMNDGVGQGLVMAIRLFQSIIAGRNRLGGDGRVDVGRTTNRFLNASNAPSWTTMPLSGAGFINFEAQDTRDMHDFGTSWLGETIQAAGAAYERDYLSTHPEGSLLTINDVSLPEGGDTPDHAGHETGLACDIRLPRKDGGSGGIKNPNTNSAYDRAAARAQLIAIRGQALFSRAFFNDRVLIEEGLCRWLTDHSDHVHFEIKSPLPAAIQLQEG